MTNRVYVLSTRSNIVDDALSRKKAEKRRAGNEEESKRTINEFLSFELQRTIVSFGSGVYR